MPLSLRGPATVADCCPCTGHSHSAGGAAARIREPRCMCRGVGGASTRPCKVSRELLSQGPSRVGVGALNRPQRADVPTPGVEAGVPRPSCSLGPEARGTQNSKFTPG